LNFNLINVDTQKKFSSTRMFLLVETMELKLTKEKESERRKKKLSFSFQNSIFNRDMFPEHLSVGSVQSKSLKPVNSIPDSLINQLLTFRVDGRTINARNVDELYPGLDRLLLRCLQTGDFRQLDNRLRRNLKPEYLLITGKHIQISVASQTQDILEKLIDMGATLGKSMEFLRCFFCEFVVFFCQIFISTSQFI